MFGVNAMKSLIVYEVLSRVVKDDKGVIGFMVKQKYKRSQPIFMSIEVLTFGLSNKNFEVVDVKLGGNGKPRGTNGFLLSKLPIANMLNKEEVENSLMIVLKVILGEMCYSDTKIKYSKNLSGMNLTYTASFIHSDYKDMEEEIAEKELNKTLKFYYKHLQKEYKEMCDGVSGFISDNGNVNVVVSRLLVQEEKFLR